MILLDHYAWSFHKRRNVRKFESSTTMSFKINDSKLLKKYNQIWKKVDILLRVEFDRIPVYDDNDKYKNKNIWW